MENIRPWCISRQLWWGHRIPVWYRGDRRDVRRHRRAPERRGWERDPDVLDTWFSSALWPFATLGWPEQTPELRAFYPTDVLSTARDIIFLWVARMMMMGLEFTGEIPFADVYVHSIIQAPDGRRMSKSLGTGIDPLDLIDGGRARRVFAEGGEFPAYGADAVRWGLLAMSSGQDVSSQRGQDRPGPAADEQAVERLAADPARGSTPDARAGGRRRRTVEDRWILSRLERAKREVDGADRALRLLPRGARALRLRLRRAVRLVPRARQAAAVRRRRRRRADAAARAASRRSRSRTRSSRS